MPSVTTKNATLVLYADNTSLLITGSNPVQFLTKVNTVFDDINEWFRSNLMFLNFDKTHFLQFWTKNSQKLNLNITLLNKHITNTINIKFLELTIDEKLSWKCHVNHVLTKLTSACYAIRIVMPLMAEETLRMIYFSYVHSLLSYGIILWGNSPHSIRVFKMQKRIIRIMTKSRCRDSCRQLFKKLGLLPLYSQYIFSLHTYIHIYTFLRS